MKRCIQQSPSDRPTGSGPAVRPGALISPAEVRVSIEGSSKLACAGGQLWTVVAPHRVPVQPARSRRRNRDGSSPGRSVFVVKIGVVGAGAVGAATVLSLIERGGTCREIVLVDRAADRAAGVAADMRYAAPLSPVVDVRAGGYQDLVDAALVVITAGANEKAGGATDRSDTQGRLRLLDTNAKAYADIVPRVVSVAPQAVLMVVTDPPDPLADLTRHLAGHDRVFSTGTLIDSLRFRVHLADRLRVRPLDVQAMVVGEHGTSEVLLWSSAEVGGIPALELLADDGQPLDAVRKDIEESIRYANITIIEGTGASQYGIGAVSARLVEAVLRDERAVLPVAAYNPDFDVTLSLVSVLGADGVVHMYQPRMTPNERAALDRSVSTLREATRRALDIVDQQPAPG
jgi:L-lactate dehydrogenase